MKNYMITHDINNNTIWLYAIIVIGITFNNSYSMEYIHGKKHSYKLPETFTINWPYNSKIYNYCYPQRDMGYPIDINCGLMHNYILERASAGKILNYKRSQEKKLGQINEDLADIESTEKNNFLTKLKLEAHKEILLKEKTLVTEKLASIPAIEERMPEEEFYKIFKNIMSKANITSDKDTLNEFEFMLKILQEADEEQFANISNFEFDLKFKN